MWNQNRSTIEEELGKTDILRLGFDFLAVVADVSARLGGQAILNHFGSNNLDIRYKGKEGLSPATSADTDSAESILGLIRKHFPDHRIYEEETGLHEGENFIWYIDPLDGTTSFIRNQRYSTVGLAVYERNEPLVAVICHPFERELLVAQKSKGAFLFELDENLVKKATPQKLEVSKHPLKNCCAYIDGSYNEHNSPAKLQFIGNLITASNNRIRLRMTGSNIDQQRQIAAGRAELSH